MRLGNGPAYFNNLLHVKYELILHGSELVRLVGWLTKRAGTLHV